MALLQAIASLWPLLKEFYKGKKLDNDNDKNEEGKSFNLALYIVDKLQASRRFAIVVILVLVVSLFVNYKAISKLMVISRDEKSQSTYGTENNKKDPLPTIPRREGENEVVVSRTVKSLQEIYRNQ